MFLDWGHPRARGRPSLTNLTTRVYPNRRTKCFILLKGRNEEEKATRAPYDLLEFYRGCRLKLVESIAWDYEAACQFMLIGAVA